ncbi:MAG: nickel/cobalt efflux transporter [Hyphomicrobium sp.]
MPDISDLIQSGSSTPWLYLPVAVMLGALHALEPGHAKSMMAAFIIAVRGTPWQAVALGTAAAVGHTIVIWGLAMAGLWLGDRLILDKAEPWLMLISGILILVIALRILVSVRAANHGSSHHGNHDHDQPRDHADVHGYYADAHARANGSDIAARYAGRQVTTSEILWFGFTAGLLPCPAAFAVLLVCLQLKEFTLGIAMVAAFSLGLAMTLVAIGVIAAWGVDRLAESGGRFLGVLSAAPYVSAIIVMGVGGLFVAQGISGILSA